MKKIITFLVFVFLVTGFTQCASDSGADAGTGDGNMPGNGGDGKGGSLAVFAIKGNYLYTVDIQNLNVFWIENPQNPVQVSRVNIGFNIETIYSLDNYLFIGSQDGMFIYDITAPESPKYLSSASHATACDPVVANQTHAFVTLHSTSLCGNNINALMIYDISDLRNPELIHSRSMMQPKGLAIEGDFLLVCDDELKIFNIADPEDPRIVRAVARSYRDVVIYNNTLFAFGDRQVSQYKWNGSDLSTLYEISSLSY